MLCQGIFIFYHRKVLNASDTSSSRLPGSCTLHHLKTLKCVALMALLPRKFPRQPCCYYRLWVIKTKKNALRCTQTVHVHTRFHQNPSPGWQVKLTGIQKTWWTQNPVFRSLAGKKAKDRHIKTYIIYDSEILAMCKTQLYNEAWSRSGLFLSAVQNHRCFNCCLSAVELSCCVSSLLDADKHSQIL